MSNINDLLKQLTKKHKVTKHKFKKGKVIKIPSLLGTDKPKSIKPKHISIPLSGARAQLHIAIGLINVPKHKKALYKSYIPRGGSFRSGKEKKVKISKQQIEAWRKFGRGVFVGHLRQYVEQYDRDYLYGYARHVVANPHVYKEKYYQEAQNYLLVHSRRGAPTLTKQYFLAKYGTTKINRLGDDLLYQQLLRLRKVTTTKAELKRVERLLTKRKKQLSHTYADYHYLQYRKELIEKKKDSPSWMQGKLLDMKEPSLFPYWPYVQKELGNWLNQSAWGKEEEFIKAFYAKHNGIDPALSIGRGREKYAYEKLIKWFIETGLEVPLHSTNLTQLKNPSLILTMKRELSKHFTQEQIDKYIRDNLTNPDNLSRSGLPDPLVDWNSLYGYHRITPRGKYFGQENERRVTENLGDIETNFTKEYNRFAKTDKAKREKFERDFTNFIPPADITSHFQMVLEHKKQMREHLKTQKKGKQRKK